MTRPDLKRLAQDGQDRRERAIVARELLAAAQAEDERTAPLRAYAEGTWDESQHQQRLFAWAAEVEDRLPVMRLLLHVPNGGMRQQQVTRNGQRFSRAGQKLKFEGLRPGYPDLVLDVASGTFHGLRIELKTLSGALSPEQRGWLMALRERGYCADRAQGWRDARHLILQYLSGDVPPQRWMPRRGQTYTVPPLPHSLEAHKKRAR